jgi:hypothetical protein
MQKWRQQRLDPSFSNIFKDGVEEGKAGPVGTRDGHCSVYLELRPKDLISRPMRGSAVRGNC